MVFSVAVNCKALTGQILVFSINGHWKEAVAYERWYILCSRKTEIYLLQEIDATTAHRYFQQCHAQQQQHNVWVKKANFETY